VEFVVRCRTVVVFLSRERPADGDEVLKEEE